ncbi:MAG: methionine synthase [Mariprofundaceae bacterium]
MKFLEALQKKVLLLDGAMGTMLMLHDLDLEKDYLDLENCSEILCETRPDVIKAIHNAYLEAGADAVETNSFGSNALVLAEFGLEDRVEELNALAAVLARQCCDDISTPDKPRFVLGSIGPGTRLPSIGHTDYDTLEASYFRQANGLIKGGVDAMLVETAQDLLQMKAAINGCRIAFEQAGVELPIIAQVTVETTGTMLLGTEIHAAMNVLEAMDVDMIGLNCATGPREMAQHIAVLSQYCRLPISVVPNAGLPELVDGKTHYGLNPTEFADWHLRFVEEDGVNMVGGCCGTSPEHIRAVADKLGMHPPVKRKTEHIAGASSLYQFNAFRQENAVFAVGERTNANGSRLFKRLLAEEDWDGIIKVGREQVKDGSHAVDVCVAYVGRPEASDMDEVIRRFATQVQAPLVIDSTETPVIEAALKRAGGKCTINSINFEDGEERASHVLKMARKFGAAVVALTIEEEGMAKDAAGKLRIAERLYDFAVNKHGLPPEDLIFDPLTFTICTGNEDDRRLGLETLEGIRLIHERFPNCQIMLGLSNISFGLKPAVRHVLNSVFMHHAMQAGMNMAILHPSKIMPLFKIDPEKLKITEDLIFDRGLDDYHPLMELIGSFPEDGEQKTEEKSAPVTVEDRLKQRIIDGDRNGLDADLDEALKTYEALDIINTILLGGMKVVGDLFGSGEMQLPFVLQSAETMKAAVAYLEPHMEAVGEGGGKGRIILATVKGDVHDIGKNLVDIILSNNGYEVINLGIKQPIENIIEAARQHKAHAIGLSGLLVKSTVIMRENLEELHKQGFGTPVLLGGAALTRKYVEEDCRASYPKRFVAYARDAFDGLHLMEKVMQGEEAPSRSAGSRKIPAVSDSAKLRSDSSDPDKSKDAEAEARFGSIGMGRPDKVVTDNPVPVPPFWGSRLLESVSLKSLQGFLNETMLFQFHWGFKKRGVKGDFQTYITNEIRPVFHDLLRQCIEENILQPRAVYGFWPCQSDGNDVIVYDHAAFMDAHGNPSLQPQSEAVEICRFSFPRQSERKGGLCLADWYRSFDSGMYDLMPLQVVSMGQRVSEVARDWFEENRYQDYLYLHGLGVEMAEAMAEYVHQRIRSDLGFASEDARDMHALLKQGYRGSRYSYGYPACPDMEQQRPLLDLLGASRIAVRMDAESFELHPEQSTSAVIAHHPQARYFSV